MVSSCGIVSRICDSHTGYTSRELSGSTIHTRRSSDDAMFRALALSRGLEKSDRSAAPCVENRAINRTAQQVGVARQLRALLRLRGASFTHMCGLSPARRGLPLHPSTSHCSSDGKNDNGGVDRPHEQIPRRSMLAHTHATPTQTIVAVAPPCSRHSTQFPAQRPRTFQSNGSLQSSPTNILATRAAHAPANAAR